MVTTVVTLNTITKMTQKIKILTIATGQNIIPYCRGLIKVKFSTDQFRPALGSGCCRLSIVTMLKKPQNYPISDFFDLTPKYFLFFSALY